MTITGARYEVSRAGIDSVDPLSPHMRAACMYGMTLYVVSMRSMNCEVLQMIHFETHPLCLHQVVSMSHVLEITPFVNIVE